MPPYHLVLRVLLAAGLGAVLGIEREMRHKPAGLRTQILIAIGAALFTIVSMPLTNGNGESADRVAAQVVTGIGFLGAGAILRHGGSVQGMTTAATIWVNAAIGMTAGAGAYGLAIATTVLALAALLVLPYVEAMFADRPGLDRRS